MARFEHLFEPLDVAGMRLKNRVVMPAMHIGMAEDGFLKDGFLDFYEERAAAGPGPALIIVGGCYPEKRGMGAPNFVAIDSDRYIPGLKELTDRIHEHDTRIAAQLYHGGRYAHSLFIGEQPVSASAVPSRFTRETPRELSIEEIADVQRHYGEAAARAREAGFDASELICAAGYIVNQFLSPLTNQRTDRYGGSTVEERLTFLLETIAAIKEATGSDFPLICRVSGSDFMEGSLGPEEVQVVAAAMVDAGVDMLNVTGGWHETRVPQITMNVPRGAYVYLAQGIREAIGRRVPVMACNRINDPDLAEQILADDRADLIGMARAFLADPEILHKALEGRVDEIRRCIACNQGCFDHVMMVSPITCMLNPRVNREREMVLEPAEEPKVVLVVGGGPAGMEAAWVAAHRGHHVVLAEEGPTPGGQGRLAAVPPGREEFSEMVRWLEQQVSIEGVEVRLGCPVTPELIADVKPDVLVLATGAEQAVPPLPGIDGDNVAFAWDVLEGRAETGQRVVMVGGGAVGLETATLLAEQGRDVTVLEMLERMGADIGLSSRWVIMKDARELGVELVPGVRVNAITPAGVLAERGGTESLIEADIVVIAVGARPRCGLKQELEEAGALDGVEVIEIGDCVRPRKAMEAIHEGFEAALHL